MQICTNFNILTLAKPEIRAILLEITNTPYDLRYRGRLGSWKMWANACMSCAARSSCRCKTRTFQHLLDLSSELSCWRSSAPSNA